MQVVTDRACQKGDVAIVRLAQMGGVPLLKADQSRKESTAAPAASGTTQPGAGDSAGDANDPKNRSFKDLKEFTSNIRVDTDLPQQWTASGPGHSYAPGLIAN